MYKDKGFKRLWRRFKRLKPYVKVADRRFNQFRRGESVDLVRLGRVLGHIRDVAVELREGFDGLRQGYSGKALESLDFYCNTMGELSDRASCMLEEVEKEGDIEVYTLGG